MGQTRSLQETVIGRIYNRHPHLAHCAVICLLIFAVYTKVVHHDFLINWDDVDYITGNPLIRDVTLQNILTLFSTHYYGNYAPLHIIAYMLDYAVWGMAPAAFKMTNVIFHTGCALLLYHIFTRLGLSLLQSLTAALLFAVHPVQVESVAWASQLKNPLSLFFFLCAWYSWDIWNKCDQDDRNKSIWYLCSLICFTFALLSKSIAIILPLILLTQELVLNKKTFSIIMAKTLLPYLLLAAACAAATLASQHMPAGGIVPYHGGSLAITMMNMLPVFSRYLTLLVYPVNLTIIYNAPLKTTPDLQIIASGLILIAFVSAWLWSRKRHPKYFFWLSLFIIGLLPVSNVVPITTMMNDRYLYYPMLGMAPLVVIFCSNVYHSINAPVFPIPTFVITGVVIMLAILSWKQIDVWKNSTSLWKNALDKAPVGAWYETANNTDFIKQGYVESLIVQATTMNKSTSDREAAARLCLTALSYDPNNYNALGLIAGIYMQDNKLLEARTYLIRLVDHYPNRDLAHVALGINYLLSREPERAAQQFEMALNINPRNRLAAEKWNSLRLTLPAK